MEASGTSEKLEKWKVVLVLSRIKRLPEASYTLCKEDTKRSCMHWGVIFKNSDGVVLKLEAFNEGGKLTGVMKATVDEEKLGEEIYLGEIICSIGRIADAYAKAPKNQTYNLVHRNCQTWLTSLLQQLGITLPDGVICLKELISSRLGFLGSNHEELPAQPARDQTSTLGLGSNAQRAAPERRLHGVTSQQPAETRRLRNPTNEMTWKVTLVALKWNTVSECMNEPLSLSDFIKSLLPFSLSWRLTYNRKMLKPTCRCWAVVLENDKGPTWIAHGSMIHCGMTSSLILGDLEHIVYLGETNCAQDELFDSFHCARDWRAFDWIFNNCQHTATRFLAVLGFSLPDDVKTIDKLFPSFLISLAKQRYFA
ncbi:uncharacterized protein LOC144109520 isoform X2 [Amblyomma americanum]